MKPALIAQFRLHSGLWRAAVTRERLTSSDRVDRLCFQRHRLRQLSYSTTTPHANRGARSSQRPSHSLRVAGCAARRLARMPQTIMLAVHCKKTELLDFKQPLVEYARQSYGPQVGASWWGRQVLGGSLVPFTPQLDLNLCTALRSHGERAALPLLPLHMLPAPRPRCAGTFGARHAKCTLALSTPAGRCGCCPGPGRGGAVAGGCDQPDGAAGHAGRQPGKVLPRPHVRCRLHLGCWVLGRTWHAPGWGYWVMGDDFGCAVPAHQESTATGSPQNPIGSPSGCIGAAGCWGNDLRVRRSREGGVHALRRLHQWSTKFGGAEGRQSPLLSWCADPPRLHGCVPPFPPWLRASLCLHPAA